MYTSEKPVYLDFEDAFKFAQKAYRDILLIANGHEVYHKDLSEHFQNIHHIDSYSDEEDYLSSLNSFKNYVRDNNLLQKDTKVVYASGLEGKKKYTNILKITSMS